LYNATKLAFLFQLSSVAFIYGFEASIFKAPRGQKEQRAFLANARANGF